MEEWKKKMEEKMEEWKKKFNVQIISNRLLKILILIRLLF